MVATWPTSARHTNGAPPTTGTTAWHNVAGGRELALGATVLALALMKEHRALRAALFATALVPLGDALIVLRAGGPLTALLPHLLGVPGVLMVAALTRPK